MVVNWELYCELPESLVDLQPISNPPTLPSSPPQQPPVDSALPPTNRYRQPFVHSLQPFLLTSEPNHYYPSNTTICLYSNNKQTTKKKKMSPVVVSSSFSSSSSSFSSAIGNSSSPGECYTHDYDEYEFLNAKPEVDSRRRHYACAGGACGGTGSGVTPVGKGRRNAAEALAYRKLAREAYLVKSVVSGGGGFATAPTASGVASVDHPAEAMAAAKKLGKKRRARLLSDHLQDFNVAVPYSLNRKNRWRTACNGAVEAVKALSAGAPAMSAGANAAADVRLKYSVVDSYFYAIRGLEDKRRVIAYRELDANGALTKKRSARSARGSPLANLTADKENAAVFPLAANDAAVAKENTCDFNVQYHFTRVHPAIKLAIGGKTGTGKQKSPAKRRCRVNMARSVYGNAVLDLDLFDDAANAAATLLFAETAGEALSTSRAPARRTYTLADFVQEGALVRRTATTPADAAKAKSAARNSASAKEALDECQFVVTDAPIDLAAYNFESSPAASDAASVIGDDASGVADSGGAPNASIIAQWSRRYAAVADTRPLVYTLSGVSAARYGIYSDSEWSALLDNGDISAKIGNAWWASGDRLAVDLSTAIRMRLKANGERTAVRLVDDALLLVAVVERVDATTLCVRLNGSFKWDVGASLLKAKLGLYDSIESSHSPFSGLFTAIADECVPAAVEHLAKNLSSDIVKTSAPRRLVPLAKAFTMYEILHESGADNAAQAVVRSADASFEMVKDGEHKAAKKNLGPEDLVAADDDDFERIEMDEFVVEERPEADDAEVPETKEALAHVADKCVICDGECPMSEVDACGHRVCTECMRAALTSRSADAYAAQQSLLSLKCPVSSCTGELTLDALAVDVPLPLVVRFAVADFVRRYGVKTLSECPNCAAFIAADQPSATNQLCCGKCATAFCVSCTRAAHWPLSCAQAARWSARCAQVCDKSNAARTAAALGCTWRARRADATTHFQMTRQMCRLRDAKSAQRFSELRQTALYLLEFGYAWLDAANHQQRGNNKTNESDALSAPLDGKSRAQLKRLLGRIRVTVDSVDDELLFCGALTDTTKLVDKVDEMDASLESFMAMAGGGKAEKPKAEDVATKAAEEDADDLEHFDLGEI